MPIKVAAAPKDATKILKTGIQHLAGVDDTLRRVEGLSRPHRTFHLGIDKLVRSKPVATAAKHVGWRFQLVDRKKRAIAAAELAKTHTGLRFASISHGPHATDNGAQTAAERWSRRKKADYEMTLLRVPGAFCVALWLRSTDGTSDAFVPIPPCPPSSHRTRFMQRKNFAKRCYPMLLSNSKDPTPTDGKHRNGMRIIG